MKRSKVRNAGWSALLVFSFLGCLELGARVWGEQANIEQIRLTFDAQLMWGVAEDHLNPTISLNSLGLRGPEVDLDAHPILISLGDSSVFGDCVTYPETFTTVAQKALAGEKLSFQPVIGAIPGYSTMQALRQLERLSSLEPDFVLIGAMWSDASLTQGETDADTLARVQRSWVVKTGLGSALDTVTRYSRLASQIRLALHPGDGKVGWIEDGAALPQPTQRSRVPLEDYRANLKKLAEQSRDLGATPVFLMLPHPLDETQSLSAYYQGYRTAMREVAAEVGAPLVDGPAWFAAHPCGGCTRFADTIHPNNVGHALLGDALADTLRPLLVKGTDPG